MNLPSDIKVQLRIVMAIAEFVNVDPGQVRVEVQPRLSSKRGMQADAVVKAGAFTFVVEWKGSSEAAVVARAAEQVSRYAKSVKRSAIPLVAVPFMGPVGRELCEKAGVSWLDLSGNARIIAPGLRVIIEGKPNKFKLRGRPASAFAPKSSRIARWLLMHPGESFTQHEIARKVEMGEGFVSRIVSRLLEADLIVRDLDGAISAHDPGLLLAAWQEKYDFSRHHIIHGHVPARSGDELLVRIAKAMDKEKMPYAVTGLSGAWVLDRFAGFRVVTVYLPEEPPPDLLSHLSFREEPRGANCWLVIPNDEGVFHGASIKDKIRCAHPVQVYLDLKGHPERAKEAAESLRENHLKWKGDAR